MKYTVRQRNGSISAICFLIWGLFVFFRSQKWNTDVSSAEYTRDLYSIGDNGTDNANTTQPTTREQTRHRLKKYPDGIFTLYELQHGAVIVPILVAAYMFLALSTVCEQYFVPSMECLCHANNLSRDVAGATFMAVGTSSPEFVTAIIGSALSSNDVSLGAILGSVAFNVLAVLGILGLYFGKSTKLDWWPLLRDLFSYCISVLALMFILLDGVVHWYEALSMLLLYGLYIVAMYFNQQLRGLAEKLVDNCSKDELGEEKRILEEDHNGNVEMELESSENDTENQNECCTIFNPPDGYMRKALWILRLPIDIALCLTIPDCRKPFWRRWYLLTTLLASIWLFLIAYVLVWMVSVMGYTFKISDTVMALTLLGAGNSMPDFIACVIVAKDGHWDMALANAVASNIFEILACLAIPWLGCTLFSSVHAVMISTSNMFVIIGGMVLAVCLMEVIIICNGWFIDRKVGAFGLIMYVVFLLEILVPVLM